ncbi:MAG: copper resistance protein NlpE [Lachnospiraceae bacterium]|nr:copper resistance protein NlpE [Lachnospiraceae bacterium]MCI9390035.1 copper resistance protein NlpE [Lachnospiraceae bacterium]MCI9470808.1 copper resistance protein NlpE [Lachnospiraceae bacterium]
MRKISTLILYILLISSISACAKNNSATLRSGTYTLQDVERDVPDDFTITIYDDGTFQCYETPISSFIRMGHYSIEKDILTLKEDAGGCSGDINRYRILNDRLSFIHNGSANYHFVPLEEGASLVWTSDVP